MRWRQMKLMVKRRDKRKFTEICRKLFNTIIAIVAAKGAPLGVVGGWVGGIFYGKTMGNSGKIIQWKKQPAARCGASLHSLKVPSPQCLSLTRILFNGKGSSLKRKRKMLDFSQIGVFVFLKVGLGKKPPPPECDIPVPGILPFFGWYRTNFLR